MEKLESNSIASIRFDKNSTLLMHIPHSFSWAKASDISKCTPKISEIRLEINRLSDLGVTGLYVGGTGSFIKAMFSRLLCDVERFVEADQEVMESFGMGVVYLKDSRGRKLREYSKEQRDNIINRMYTPYHKMFTGLVGNILEVNGVCNILDCHTYNQELEYINKISGMQKNGMPDICIGTSDFHTPKGLAEKIEAMAISRGYSVEINKPFSGTIVPMKYFNKNKRVHSIMLEINRNAFSTYEQTKQLRKFIEAVKEVIEAER